MKLPLALFLTFARNLLADDVGPLYDPYDAEAWELNYGYYPYRTYQSFDQISPAVRKAIDSPACDDGLYTMFTPRGYSISEPQTAILDNKGELVWAQATPGQAYDLVVQEFQGQKYLSYWVGDDRIRGHGAGEYVMLNSSYQEVFRISALNNRTADLHEMVVTPEGTALITIYEVYPTNVTKLRESGFEAENPEYIWDCLFQEIDIASNRLLFEWRASDHYALNETFHEIADTGPEDNPFDYFHINSVQKDEVGNYIVSARYTHTVTYINGTSGEIIWVLGGKRNAFKDLSDGNATNFAWQHDARFHSLEAFPEILHDDIKKGRSQRRNGMVTKLVSIFDNAAEDLAVNNDLSRGLLLEVSYPDPVAPTRHHSREATHTNTDTHTVRLIQSYDHPQSVLSSSQGSFQVIPSKEKGHDPKILVGYGFNAVWTEFDSNGTVLCDTHFGTNFSWGRGDVQSYRTMKYAWIGTPSEPPNAVLAGDGDAVYVSWNGATEVRRWVLEHSTKSRAPDQAWRKLATADKIGFETELEFDEVTTHRYLRVRAVDQYSKTLGVSRIVDMGWEAGLADVTHIPVPRISSFKVFLLFCFNVATLYGLFQLYRRGVKSFQTWRWKRNNGIYLYSPVMNEA